MAWLDRLFNQHKFVRRFCLLWAMGLTTWATFNAGELETGEFVAVVGLVSTAIGFYQWARGKDA